MWHKESVVVGIPLRRVLVTGGCFCGLARVRPPRAGLKLVELQLRL